MNGLCHNKHIVKFSPSFSVGCTNFVYMFHVLNGVLPANQSFLDLNVHQQRNNSRLIHLSPEEREWRLKKYFKVVMLRDPAERMLSAYMDKVHMYVSTSILTSKVGTVI